MQGARTRSVESPWACQVILLARTEGRRGRRGMLLIVVRRSISTTLPTSLPTSCFKLPALLARTEGRREHGVLLYSCADQCRCLRYLFLLAQRAQRTRSFVIFVRRCMPVNAKYKRRSVLRLYEYDFQLPLQTSNVLLPTSFGCLPDVKFLLGTDFATDRDGRTNQHQVFDDVLPFEGQYHGEV